MKRILQFVVAAMLMLSVCRLMADEPKSTKSKSAKTSSQKDLSVIVRVNGLPITEVDLEFFAKTLKLTADEVPQHREPMIERLIDRQLLRAFLQQKKVAADPKLLDEHLTRLKTRLKAHGEDFDKLLAKSGFTEESLRHELSLPLDWEAYVLRETNDAKFRNVWKERKHEFDGSEVRAAHIVLKSDNPDADEKTLQELRSQIVAKEISFVDAAKKYSQSPAAEKGGDLGRFGFRGKLTVYPQVAFGLKVGEISQPFRSQYGVHLLTVTERIEGQLSLEDARPEILQRLS